MAEVTAFRNNALPYPVYGVPWTVVFPLLDADGDPVTGATCDSEVSLNGNTAADCTNEGTEIPFTTATNKGMYYLTLTAAEMTADIVTVTIYSATSKATAIVLYPRKLVTLASGTSQGGAAGYITLAASSIAFNDQYNGCLCVATIDTNVEARVISDCTASNQQAAVSPGWNVAPDADDTYIIYLPEGMQIPKVDVGSEAGRKIKVASTDGDWGTAGTWEDGVVPSAGDSIFIKSGVDVTVAASLNLGLYGPYTILGTLSIDSGQTVAVVPEGCEIAINSGTITDNYGIVWTNHTSGTVTNNYGKVLTNSGTVGANLGVVGFNNATVTTNGRAGHVYNNGFASTIGTNVGIVWLNVGTVTAPSNGVILYGTGGALPIAAAGAANGVVLGSAAYKLAVNASGHVTPADGSITSAKFDESTAFPIDAAGVAANVTELLTRIPDETAGVPGGLTIERTAQPPAVRGDSAMTAIRSGDYIYIRTVWSVTHDLIQKMDLNIAGATTYNNNAVQFVSSGLVLNTTTDAAIVAGAVYTTTLATDQADDNCPISLNDSYMGGNHGEGMVVVVTVASHDKTVADVGSSWTDGAGSPVTFYLMRIVDTTHLWFLSANTGTAARWAFNGTLTGNLTHAAGATHTAGITVSSTAAGQLLPGVSSTLKRVVLDGATELTADGSYPCRRVDVLHNYAIKNPADCLDYVVAGVGWSSAPDFAADAIDDTATVELDYRFGPSGGCAVGYRLNVLQAVENMTVGLIQAFQPDIPASGTHHGYVPKVNAATIGGHSYDFANIVNYSTATDAALYLLLSDCIDQTEPANRFLHQTRTSGGAKNSALAYGWCPRVGAGAPLTHAGNLTTDFRFLYLYTPYDKDYPALTRLLDVSTTSVIEAVGFRYWTNYSSYADATAFALYDVGDETYLWLGYHTNKPAADVALPAYLIGRKIETVDTVGNFTCNSTYVTATGINVTVTGSYGDAVLRLYTPTQAEIAADAKNSLTQATAAAGSALAVQNKLPSKDKLTGTANADGDIELGDATGSLPAAAVKNIFAVDMDTIEATAPADSLCAVVLAALHFSLSGNTLTIKKTDGTTFTTVTVGTEATADPVVSAG